MTCSTTLFFSSYLTVSAISEKHCASQLRSHVHRQPFAVQLHLHLVRSYAMDHVVPDKDIDQAMAQATDANCAGAGADRHLRKSEQQGPLPGTVATMHVTQASTRQGPTHLHLATPCVVKYNACTGYIAPWYVAAGHIITALLGPGILAVPYIMSRLGWVASIAAFVMFFCLTLWTSSMMAEVYQVGNKRHGRYDIAVRNILGSKHATFLACCQNINLVLANVGFQIAAADSLSYIATAVCKLNDTSSGTCWNSQPILTVAVGVAQLALSQLKNLQAARISSAIGAAASVVYCLITLVLAARHAGNKRGRVDGYIAPTSDKVFAAFNALGAVAFGLNAPIITFEVADTLRAPPKTSVAMKRSLALSLGTCVSCFLVGGTLAYLAIGDAIADNFLLAFEATAPAWVLIFGSVMVVLNMVPAYQVCAQPTFAAIEAGLLNSRPTLTCHSTRRRWLMSALFRSCYVGVTTGIAVALPFFAVILGLVGAATFYQTGVLYPILLHRAVYPPTRRVNVLMWGVLLLAAAVTLLMLVGSVAVIAKNASSLSPWVLS